MIFPPFLDYQTWLQTQLRPNYNTCTLSTADCNRRGQKCTLRHIKPLTEEDYYHKCEFGRLVYYVDSFYEKYPEFDGFQIQNAQLKEKYLREKKTIDFYEHLIRDHTDKWFGVACTQFARSTCKTLGYFKKQVDPSVFQKIKLIKKQVQLKRNSKFMEQKLNFGRYRGKSWSFVQQHHPQYVDWVAQNLISDPLIRLTAKTIISRRNSKEEKRKQFEKWEKNLSFMNHQLNFGKYAFKTWAWVEKHNPSYIDWTAQNLADYQEGQLATIIKGMRIRSHYFAF